MTRRTARDAAAPAALTDLACACASARQVARTLTQLYDRWLIGTGLEAPQFALLMALDKHGAVSQAALGRRYALDKTTMSRNLKLFEREGWISVSARGRQTGTPLHHHRRRARSPRRRQAGMEEGAGSSAQPA